jgi:hypothetical protein
MCVVAPHVSGSLVALTLQPEDSDTPPVAVGEGDVILFVAFVAIVVLVFGFDMARTWWETTRWRRDARRRRREIR